MLKKTSFLLSFISLSVILTSFKPAEKLPVLKTIIIDAGHGLVPGGGHNGAKGTYSYEDDICLAVSKKLVRMISEQFPDIKIIETRPTENIVDLRERANIANRNRGDLFISIHVNAMPPIKHRQFVGNRTEVYYTGKGKRKKRHTRKIPQYHYYETPDVSEKGTQTYIWGAHKAEDKEIAIRENAPMLAEENYQEKYGDVDPNSPEFIALSLAKTKQFTIRSSTLAGMVEDEFAKIGRISGGKHQRQVGIWVLQATAMPSVLVETGFITNPDEERYLNSDNGQEEIASCVTNAVKQYIGWLEKRQIKVTHNTPGKPSDNTSPSSYSFLSAIEQQEKQNRQGK
ncbi:MAG: N-acetylmuramoyl-L-alanine amidase family protein [Candidatus Dadabacteria bacterium]